MENIEKLTVTKWLDYDSVVFNTKSNPSEHYAQMNAMHISFVEWKYQREEEEKKNKNH